MFTELIFTFLVRVKEYMARYLFSIFLAFSPCCLLAQAETLDQRVARLETLVENQALLGILEQVDVLENQVRNLRGEIDTQEFELVDQKQQLAELLQSIELRLQSLEESGHRQLKEQSVLKEAVVKEQTIENSVITSDGQIGVTDKQQSTEDERIETSASRSSNTVASEGSLSDTAGKKTEAVPQGSEAQETDSGFSIKPPVTLVDEVAAEFVIRDVIIGEDYSFLMDACALISIYLPGHTNYFMISCRLSI